jgi:hypothetical protein
VKNIPGDRYLCAQASRLQQMSQSVSSLNWIHNRWMVPATVLESCLPRGRLQFSGFGF